MVIAEEVERLAQRAATASKTIAGLVKTIQSETHEAVSAMEGTTREVVGGSSLALTSARSLQEIEEVSNRLAELTQTISRVTSQHARGSHEVARNMERISDLTNRTAGSTRDVAVSIRDLASLADRLRESMNRFKLPLKAA
jgi:twitching motility protein PilJ